MGETLSVDALLVWGRDYLHLLEAKSADPIHVPIAVLKQYLAKADEGLALLRERDARAAKRGGGRPKGSGMGALAAR
jgi:hypothetical protein